jgi:hypothetical protein
VLVSERDFGQVGDVTETWCIRGRPIETGDLDQIGSWMAAHPDWSRRRLSEELARLWDWRTPTGQLKDIATRDVLNRLEARGLITLPARQRRGGRQVSRAAASAQGLLSLESAVAARPAGLSELLPLSWQLAGRGEPQRAVVARYLSEHHYLGYPDPLGQIHYLVRDRAGRDVACLLFGLASWKVAARDVFIGWSDAQRQKGLRHLANNSRFLILPGVQTPHLASHLLAAAVRRLRVDWPARQGVPLWLVETFVEQGRFAGTCYRAANWLKAGQTQGRTRNDRWHRHPTPIKDVYLLPLTPHFRRRLCVP